MANRDSLHDTINRARDETSDGDKTGSKETAGKAGSSSAKSFAVLAGIALALLLFKILVVDSKSRQLTDDMAVSAYDLFMEADASVINYFMATRELPDTLPVIGLRPFVTYERLDPDRYTLTVNIPPHDTTIERNAALISPPEDINALLNL